MLFDSQSEKEGKKEKASNSSSVKMTKSSSKNKNSKHPALEASAGTQLTAKVASATKVLMVGSGGIGCELLKNLVMTGFTDICIVHEY